MRGLALITAASVLLAGCAAGSARPAADGSHSDESALNLWKGFPAAASPRPLVLAGPTVLDPATGFGDDSDKLAYISGQFTVAGTLPTTPSSWHGRPLVTAAQALAELRGSTPGAAPTGSVLAVTAVRLGTAPFATDRGRQLLPAWQFRFAGVRDVASVLAVAPANRWPAVPRPLSDTDELAVRIAPAGDSITILFAGSTADPGPCHTDYQADTVQSNSAVLVTVRDLPATSQATDSDGNPIACPGVGYPRSVTVRLSPALGGRVLIDSYGIPLPIR